MRSFVIVNKCIIPLGIIIESYVKSIAESKLGYRLVAYNKPWKHHKMLPVVESEKSHIKEVWSTGRVNRQQFQDMYFLQIFKKLLKSQPCSCQ